MKKLFFSLGFILLSCMVFFGCKKNNEDTSTQSKHNETRSHKNGTDCLVCHTSGGAASEYKWIMAGSVYQTGEISANPNGMIYLWSGVSGTGDLKATLQVDGLGNFFTTASVIPSSPVYPQVINATGSAFKNMPLPITTGNCNGCHGISTGKIWVN
jgi:hypothetical protein